MTACQNLTALAAALLPLILAPSGAHAGPRPLAPYAAIPTAHATTWYHRSNGELAKTITEAFELAHSALGQDLGYPNGKITIHIYDSTEAMVDGLMAVLGYDQPKAELIAMIGVSPSTRSTMHFHAKTKNWGPFLWHAVAHEYAHGLTEQSYGMGVAASARWLYEGLGDYAAERALRAKSREFETTWSRSRFKLAFKALIWRDLLPLERLTTEQQWLANIAKSRYAWDVQYAQAYAAVTYLVERHGFDGLKRVLEGIKKGLSCEDAMEEGLGVSLSEFDAAWRAFMFLKGMTDLYRAQAAGGFVAAGLMVATALLMLHSRRRRAEARSRGESAREPSG